MKLGNFCQLTAGIVLLFFVFSGPVQASPIVGYIGPGAGLSMLGALFAVFCVLVLALLGPILYPIRLFLTWRRKRLNMAKMDTREA